MSNKNGVYVSFSIKREVPEEVKALWKISRYQPAKQEHYLIANDIASAQALRDYNNFGLPDINWIASIVFEAGRITGIREERRKRSKSNGKKSRKTI